MERRFLAWGFFLGGLSVIIGAFGAHALKELLNQTQLQSFETGIRYQMYHAILLLIIGKMPNMQSRWVLNLIVAGVLLFSFSIYLLNLKDALNAPFLSFLGPVTPVGGLLLITSWALLFRAVIVSKKQ